jgi:hypothetical protein
VPHRDDASTKQSQTNPNIIVLRRSHTIDDGKLDGTWYGNLIENDAISSQPAIATDFAAINKGGQACLQLAHLPRASSSHTGPEFQAE